jgi:DNA-binding response OmpR family regulator/predicted regulator of Ras-like GTPase activity (Roadblock/LC7/MglB family)
MEEFRMRFIVVDPNVGFATLLAEELKRLGHHGDRFADEQDALASARVECPDIAFLDMGLGVSQLKALGRALRTLDPSVRLVVIPMNGETLPEEVAALPVQGTLPKPFFLPELPARVERVLTAPLSRDARDEDPIDASLSRPRQGEVASESKSLSKSENPRESEEALTQSFEISGRPRFSSDAFNANRKRIESLMETLSREVGADGVILTRDDHLLAWVGRFNENEAETLAQIVVQGWKSSAQVARILGQEQLRFEQSIAGGNYLLYAVSVADAILAVPVKGPALLGLLRQTAREIAKQIAVLCLD